MRIALLVFGALALGDARAQDWKLVGDSDGVKLESRKIEGERFAELRASATLGATPQAIADYLVGRYLDEKNPNLTRTFVQRTRDVIVWSDVLSTPLTSDRCYAMRFEREDRDDGSVRVGFTTLPYIGAGHSDCVAMHARGEWLITPAQDGANIRYVSLTDFGGQVPASLVRRSLTAAAVSSVRKVAAGARGLPLPRGIGDR